MGRGFNAPFFLASPKGAKMKRTIMAVFFCLLCAGALSSTMAQPYIPSSIFPSDRPTVTERYNFKDSTQQFSVHVGNRSNGYSSSYEVQYRRHTYKGVLEWQKAKFVVDTTVSASGCKSTSDTLYVTCAPKGDFEARFIIRKSQFKQDGILDSAVDLRVVGTLHYNGNTQTITEESNVLTLVMYRRLTVGIEGVGKIEVNYPDPDDSNGKRVSYSSEKYPFQQFFLMNHDPIRIYTTKTNSCYEFSKWVHEKDGSVVWQASAFDDLNLVSDSGFVAVFEPTCIHFLVKSGEMGQVSGKTRGGKALTSLDTTLQVNTTYIFTATPDEKAAFKCWTKLDDTVCVSKDNPINVRSAQDTSLMARFIPLPPKVTLANVDDDTSSMFDHVFGRTSLNFAGKVSGVANKSVEIYLQYSMGDGWEDTETQYGVFPDDNDIGVNFEIDKEANTIIESGSIKNTLGVFKSIRRKTWFRICAKYSFHNVGTACSDSVVIQWKQPVIFESASGEVIYDAIEDIGVKNKLPTDRSKLALPRETDTTRYSYHWESNDGEKIESKTTCVTSEDTIHYHVVADDITFRVRYLDYKGNVYKTDWLDSNTTIKDAPKPNTLQDAAYWIRAVGGSRDLPLVLDGPADIHAAYDYKVRFLDYDGNELSEGFVSYGKVATPPEKEPTRDGYVFDGWDKKFNKVTDTMTVTATYKKAKAASSSSSAKAKSSSSKGKSSSSKGGKDAIASAAQVLQFSLATVGREIQVAGACVGSAYAVLDMQGRVIAKGRVSATDFSIRMDRSATYLMRIGNQTQTVKIK